MFYIIFLYLLPEQDRFRIDRGRSFASRRCAPSAKQTSGTGNANGFATPSIPRRSRLAGTGEAPSVHTRRSAPRQRAFSHRRAILAHPDPTTALYGPLSASGFVSIDPLEVGIVNSAVPANDQGTAVFALKSAFFAHWQIDVLSAPHRTAPLAFECLGSFFPRHADALLCYEFVIKAYKRL